MAELWYREDSGARWQSVTVPDDRFIVVDRLPERARPRLSGRKRLEGTQRIAVPRDRLVLVRTGTARDEAWHGLSFRGCPFLMNGRLVREGLVSVPDRAVIRVGWSGPKWYFSAGRIARIQVLSQAPDVRCPRCRGSLEAGQSAVACPRCGAIHHQDSHQHRLCWTYGEAGCASCGAPTGLDGDAIGWTPDEL